MQHLYDSTNKLASLKMTNYDIVSFMTEAQSKIEELKMFLEVESLEEIVLLRLCIIINPKYRV